MATQFTVRMDPTVEKGWAVTVETDLPVEFRGATRIQGNTAIAMPGDVLRFRVAGMDEWMSYSVSEDSIDLIAQASASGWKMARGA